MHVAAIEIGVVVAQRQLELMYDAGGQNETAWFFLDDFKGWLDLSGEIADILAVNLVVTLAMRFLERRVAVPGYGAGR